MSRGTRLAVFALVPALALGGCVGSVMLLGAQQAAGSVCSPTGPGVVVHPKTVPPGPVAGYSGVQLVNAAYVMNAAQALGLDERAQTNDRDRSPGTTSGRRRPVTSRHATSRASIAAPIISSSSSPPGRARGPVAYPRSRASRSRIRRHDATA